jgi:hypothetical protein
MAKKKTTVTTETGTEIALVAPEKKTRAKRTTEATAPKAKAKPEPEASGDAAPTEEQVVFAFRLSRAERDAIHAAAGPAKASRFVKTLAIAAAAGDIDVIHAIVAETGRTK